MAAHRLGLFLSPQPELCFSYGRNRNVHGVDFISRLPAERRRSFRRRSVLRPHTGPNLVISSSLETRIDSVEATLQGHGQSKDSPVLLDVTGMMCGACVSRVKNILSADERVDSVVVNMLTETAAVKLKKLEELPAGGSVLETDYPGNVAETLARRLTECGFPTKRRVSGMGVAENVRKWKDLVSKKEELLAKSRNRVAFAWTLVALCCGSHASHIFHSLGIHIAHGNDYFSKKKKIVAIGLREHFGSNFDMSTEKESPLFQLSTASQTT